MQAEILGVVVNLVMLLGARRAAPGRRPRAAPRPPGRNEDEANQQFFAAFVHPAAHPNLNQELQVILIWFV
jgi:hypothetical protein